MNTMTKAPTPTPAPKARRCAKAPAKQLDFLRNLGVRLRRRRSANNGKPTGAACGGCGKRLSLDRRNHGEPAFSQSPHRKNPTYYCKDCTLAMY